MGRQVLPPKPQDMVAICFAIVMGLIRGEVRNVAPQTKNLKIRIFLGHPPKYFKNFLKRYTCHTYMTFMNKNSTLVNIPDLW
jgi:hypothetical protein